MTINQLLNSGNDLDFETFFKRKGQKSEHEKNSRELLTIVAKYVSMFPDELRNKESIRNELLFLQEDIDFSLYPEKSQLVLNNIQKSTNNMNALILEAMVHLDDYE